MILSHWKIFGCSCTLILLLLAFCAYAAYRENRKRELDDSKKKDFHPLSPWLTPMAPFIWLARYVFLAPWSILFGLFLVIFPFILILLRPISPEDPIKRLILKIGNGVLKINTSLLQALGFQPAQTLRPFE